MNAAVPRFLQRLAPTPAHPVRPALAPRFAAPAGGVWGEAAAEIGAAAVAATGVGPAAPARSPLPLQGPRPDAAWAADPTPAAPAPAAVAAAPLAVARPPTVPPAGPPWPQPPLRSGPRAAAARADIPLHGRSESTAAPPGRPRERGVEPAGDRAAPFAAHPALPLAAALPPPAPLRAATVQQHAALQRQAERPPVVQVTIERLEVRATAAPVRERPAPRPRSTPAVPLAEYLRQRTPGGRG